MPILPAPQPGPERSHLAPLPSHAAATASSTVRDAGVVPFGGPQPPVRGRARVAPPPAPAPRESLGIGSVRHRRHALAVEHIDVSDHGRRLAESARYEGGGAGEAMALHAPGTARSARVTRLALAARAQEHRLESRGVLLALLGGADGAGAGAGAAPRLPLHAQGQAPAQAMAHPRPQETPRAQHSAARAHAFGDHLGYSAAGGLVAVSGELDAGGARPPPPGRHRKVADQASAQVGLSLVTLPGGAAPEPPSAGSSTKMVTVGSLQRNYERIFGGREVQSMLPHVAAPAPAPAPPPPRPPPGSDSRFVTETMRAHTGAASGPPAAHSPRKRTFGGVHHVEPRTALW